MAELTLNAVKRETSTKGDNNELRRNGNIPGVFYSSSIEPIKIVVAENALKPFVYTTETHLINLIVDSNLNYSCILKDIQFDPITDKIIHFDLQGVNKDEVIQLEVPILYKGSAIGVKEGGVLQELLHKLEVECLPSNIPDHLEVDITNLKLNGAIHVADLTFENVKILSSPNSVLITVATPRSEKETVAEEGDAPKMPEVIGKGKTSDEEE